MVGDVLYPASECAAAVAAASAAEEREKAERQQFDSDAQECLSGKQDFATVAERFTAKHRREQPMVNSYNAIIQFCIRSNMDVKVLLRDSDARGAIFYILNYSTKTETTMDALLNLLAPVVERIKDERDGAPAAVIAAGLVRACSCKTVAHMSIGAPAAASKVLGYSDAKCSTETTNCPMWSMLREASAAFDDPAPPPTSPGHADEEEKGGQDDNLDSDDDEDGGGDVIISGATGKLRASTIMHHLYFRRCHKDDTGHPYYNMCYIVWTRLVRVEPSAPTLTSKTPAPDNSDDRSDDDEPEGEDIEDCCDAGPSKARGRKRGRRRSDRHGFVGLPKVNKQQVR